MKLSILFVDDDRLLLEGIGRLLMLERNDISFLMATSGEEALKMLKMEKIDVIVSDHLMEGISGLNLLYKVKKEYPEIKRVMLSAQIHDHIYEEAGELADKYISKPCDTMVIISEIERLFSS